MHKQNLMMKNWRMNIASREQKLSDYDTLTFLGKGSQEIIGDGFRKKSILNIFEKNIKEDKEQLIKEKQTLEDELNKLPYTKHLDDGQYNDGQLAGFELGATWGYNKAKETLFTEEQVREAIQKARHSYATSFDIIQSLKQPK